VAAEAVVVLTFLVVNKVWLLVQAEQVIQAQYIYGLNKKRNINYENFCSY